MQQEVYQCGAGGSVGRAVASNVVGWIQSLVKFIQFQLCWKDENEEKEAGLCLIFIPKRDRELPIYNGISCQNWTVNTFILFLKYRKLNVGTMWAVTNIIKALGVIVNCDSRDVIPRN